MTGYFDVEITSTGVAFKPRDPYPWFSLYDEAVPNVAASGPLSTVASVAQKDNAHGFKNQQDNSSVEVKPTQVQGLPASSPNAVRDGKW